MTLRQIWPLVAYGALNIDLGEEMTETLSNVLIESNRMVFLAPFFFLDFELGGVVILTPSPHRGEGGLDRHPGAG